MGGAINRTFLCLPRNFLQKSLLQGFETFGMENQRDVHHYCNVLAWDIKQAIFNKFKTDADNTGQSVSKENREKVGKRNAFTRST
jgi:hypothetical protein